MSGDQMNQWKVRVLGSAFGILISLVGWFLVRMVNANDAATQDIKEIKNIMQDLRVGQVEINGRITVVNKSNENMRTVMDDRYAEFKDLRKNVSGW